MTQPAPLRPSTTSSPLSRIRPDEIEREHLYRRDGAVVARKVLLKQRDAEGKKQMRWQRPNGSGGWLDGLDGFDPGLFGLDEAVALKRGGGLIWCEGEKDAAVLLALKVPAVSSPHGATGKVLPSYAERVIRAGFTRVYVIGDHDGAGLVYNQQVTQVLHAGGMTEARPVLWDADDPQGFDVADFLARHPSDGSALLIARCQQAQAWVPPAAQVEGMVSPASPTLGAILVRMSDVQAEAVRWLWTGRLARGKFTMLAGDPGLGKSFITLDLAARLTTGRPWPDGEALQHGPADVVLLAAEDGLADTVKPRLDAMGADARRVHVLRAIGLGAADGDERQFSLERDIKYLEQAISDTKAALVVIDPISSYLGAINSHSDTEVRSVLQPLIPLAERTGAAILGLSHLNKDTKASPHSRLMNSIAFVAVPRIVLVVGAAPDELNPFAPGAVRVLASLKQNICEPAAPWAYRTVDNRVDWLSARQDVRTDLLLAGPIGRDSDARQDVEAFLCGYLADGQPHPSDEVMAAAKDAGITPDRLHRTRRKICEKPRRVGYGSDGYWTWRLSPEYRAEGSIDGGLAPIDRGLPSGAIYGDISPASPMESASSSLIAPAAINEGPAIYGQDSSGPHPAAEQVSTDDVFEV